ncbi:hypothetical protein SO802_004051 [Lithocarpus litseifolius]|uniref:Plastocyanin-like domain-containing protein n=1 Tax=Lithocarpus litseifolius TaxID=425828 RepID=A0AAW2E4F4_9ROSI
MLLSKHNLYSFKHSLSPCDLLGKLRKCGLKGMDWFLLDLLHERFRISNVGLKTSINFRIQDHSMRLVEIEGSYITQDDEYDSLDIHVGQSYSVLVTAKNNTNCTSYPMIASSRFTENILFGLGVIRYPGSVAYPLGPISPGPTPCYKHNSPVQPDHVFLVFGEEEFISGRIKGKSARKLPLWPD